MNEQKERRTEHNNKINTQTDNKIHKYTKQDRNTENNRKTYNNTDIERTNKNQ